MVTANGPPSGIAATTTILTPIIKYYIISSRVWKLNKAFKKLYDLIQEYK
jgi:hypothetical protein